MNKKENRVQKILKDLAKKDENFMQKMKNKSFKLGVESEIRNKLNPTETISVIDIGGDEKAWIEGSYIVKNYFNELETKREANKKLFQKAMIGVEIGIAIVITYVIGNNVNNIKKENNILKKENIRLIALCEKKDGFFKEAISDGLKHRSSLAARYMNDRKKYLNHK